jgi:transposase
MTKQKVRELYRQVNHSDKYTYSSAARKFNVCPKTIKRWLEKKNIRKYKKKKSPKYTETQKIMVKRQCAWLYRYYRSYDFVIDDEKYFTLSHSMNDSYFSSPTKSKTPEEVSHNFKSKFEPKLMLWIAISKYGVSKSYFRPSGQAINQNIYLNKCIKKRLIPFINANHSDNNYLFWPDKASAHYAKKVVNFLNEKKINFVPKYRNPTNVPQCRPIEDFFADLTQIVYANGWKAENIPQLRRRVQNCIKKLDLNVVKKTVQSVYKRLRKCGQSGPMAVVH